MTNIKSWLIPFRVGGPIQEPAHFVGHKDDVEEIIHAMLRLQNISLRGERRTGKTSLLLYLAHPESESQLPDNHIPVYFNLQAFASARAVDVWLAIAAAIAERLEQQHPERMAYAQQFLATIAELITPSEGPPLFGAAFGRGLTDLKGAGFNIHLLFDEFDQTVRNPDLGDSFYDTLRSLPTRAGNISYVIASRTGLSALQPTYNKVSSPLFNIFTTIVLKPLREDEVYRLIFSYFTQAGLDFFLAEKLCQAAPFLYESTGYHPFFLQALCYHLCARLDEPDWPAGKAVDSALRAFERDAKAHFEFYWNISAEEEQEVMRKLALGELSDWYQHRGVVQSLQDRCLVIQSDSGWRLFSSLFARWILEQQMSLSQDASYTFADYFSLQFELDEILAYFGYSFQIKNCILPQATLEAGHFSDLKSRLAKIWSHISLTSYAAKREFLLTPVLLEVAIYTQAQIKVEYVLNVNQQLKGTLDYYLQGKNNLLVLEAKKAAPQRAFTQLAVSLVALDQSLESEAKELYGVLSMGEMWRFGILERQTKQFTQDIKSYRVPADLDDLIKILVAILSG